jgi:hypothetical protein
MALKIFISYSTYDIEIVNRIKNELNQTEYEIFIAEYSTLPGEELSESIQYAIRNCDVFVVLWSKNSERSNWVPQEIGFAKGLDAFIIPVLIDKNIQPPGFISGTKYVDLTKDIEQNLQTLKEMMMRLSIKKSQKQALGWGILGFLAYIAFVKE